jgi:uncharacterized protein (DUF697 family)/GTP-binding protein EngB required for normal cell division
MDNQKKENTEGIKKNLENEIDNNSNNTSFNEQFFKEQKDLEKKLKKPNILIIGRTGVGKSTIINDIFGENLVEVGVGKPITKNFKKIHNIKTDVVLYDSEGYEIDEKDGDDFIENTLNFINSKPADDEGKIHLVWLVISANSNRVTDYELKLYEIIKSTSTPIAVIFSKCDETNADDLNPMIQRLFPEKTFEKNSNDNDSPFFTISSEINLENEKNFFTKEPIIKWSVGKLPEICELAFISSQKVSLDLKQKLALKIVKEHSAGNAFTGFIPIPGADAPILMASQTAMLVRIFKAYGVSGTTADQIAKSTILGTLASSLGKALVGRLLKFIPIVGTVVGGIINASVASSITFAMGASTNAILYKFYDGKILNKLHIDEDLVDFVKNNFDEYFKKYFNKKSNKNI